MSLLNYHDEQLGGKYRIPCLKFSNNEMFVNYTLGKMQEQTGALSKAFFSCEVAQSCPTLRNPMDCSLPHSSVHGFSRQEC